MASVANPSPGTAPANVAFPVGTFEFEIGGLSPGGATVVTIFLEPGVVANTFYRFGPTPAKPAPHWYPFLFNGETGARIFSDRIEVHLVDGKLGDDDLTRNGVIRDPAAPGVTTHPWRNPLTHVDVDNNGVVASLDVLVLVNEINANGTRELPATPAAGESFPPFFDVDGNNQLTAADVLDVINFINDGINQGALPEPEGFSLDDSPQHAILLAIPGNDPPRQSSRSVIAADAGLGFDRSPPAARRLDPLRRLESIDPREATDAVLRAADSQADSAEVEAILDAFAADVEIAWQQAGCPLPI